MNYAVSSGTLFVCPRCGASTPGEASGIVVGGVEFTCVGCGVLWRVEFYPLAEEEHAAEMESAGGR